jgi:hypothetical protein
MIYKILRRRHSFASRNKPNTIKIDFRRIRKSLRTRKLLRAVRHVFIFWKKEILVELGPLRAVPVDYFTNTQYDPPVGEVIVVQSAITPYMDLFGVE